jgi:copper chaperone CopZ
MNTKISLVIAFMVIGITSVIAQDIKTESFMVYGNCGMCKSRIEKAAKSIDGVNKAEWDEETKMIEVTYKPEEVKILDVKKAIVKVGHDTDILLAKDEVYEALPGCCQYERRKKE